MNNQTKIFTIALVLVGVGFISLLLIVGNHNKKEVVKPTHLTPTNITGYTTTNNTPQYSAEDYRIGNYVGNAWIDILNYTRIHNDNLAAQLKMVRNGTADRVVDNVLQQKVDSLHDFLTKNISADTLVRIGADEILWQVYNLDDVLNPKNVTEVEINSPEYQHYLKIKEANND